MLLKANSDLNFELEQQQQEIDASANYIELLTRQLVENGQSSHNETNKSESMTDLLSDYLNNDSEVEDGPCTAKQTSHYAASIAADIVKGYTNWIAILEGDKMKPDCHACGYCIKSCPENAIEFKL